MTADEKTEKMERLLGALMNCGTDCVDMALGLDTGLVCEIVSNLQTEEEETGFLYIMDHAFQWAREELKHELEFCRERWREEAVEYGDESARRELDATACLDADKDVTWAVTMCGDSRIWLAHNELWKLHFGRTVEWVERHLGMRLM